MSTASSSSLRTGLKRDRDEHDQDSSLPNTKRHLRTTLNNTFSAAALERKLATLQTNCADLEKKVREKDQKLDLLEKDRRWLHDRETEERQGREREEKEAREREAQLKRNLSEARISLSDLEVSHADLKDSHFKLVRTHEHQVKLLKAQLEEVQKQAMFLETRVEEEKNAAKARVASSFDLSASAPSLSQSTSSAPDADHRLLTAELKRQASYLRQLESTNTRLNADLIVLKSENSTLRERNATVEVLREDKRGLESRLSMKEAEIEKLVQKMEQVRRSSSSRRSSGQLPLNPSTLAIHLDLDQDEPEDDHPTVQATSQLASLRLEHAALLDAHGTALAELTAVKRERDALQESGLARRPEIQVEVQSERVEISNLRIRLRLKEEELETTLKELAFLEAAVAQLTSDSKSQSETDPSALASVHESRVQHLEGLYTDAKRANADLRAEIEGLLEKLKRSREREAEAQENLLKQVKEAQQRGQKASQQFVDDLAKTKAEYEKEKEKSSELEKALDAVEQTLFDLRGEIAGGRHIPPNTRVLEMKDNPHAEWEAGRTAVLERLKGENQALLKRLADVEEALKAVDLVKAQADSTSQPAATLVPRESLDLAVKEKEELEDVLKQKEKRLLRLQQVFKAKSAEFREAIESIMGVKLAFYPNGQVRVTSLFDLNASFVFGPDKTLKSNSPTETGGMNMQLVATGEGGPQDLPDMMRYWIETEACIPGFLASITLECYESSKKRPVE